MKLFLFANLFILSSLTFSNNQLTPYTLVGGPNDCSLTVHKKGFEAADGELVDQTNPRHFYADVSISFLPGITFHLKTINGERYLAYEQVSGYRLVVMGADFRTHYPMSGGIFGYFDRLEEIQRCDQIDRRN